MDKRTDEMQRRLDELGENIEAAREQAEADGLLPEDDADDREPTLENPDPDSAGEDDIPGEATG